MALQFIRNRKKNVWYVYAWKGGPLVMRHEGMRRPALNSDASTKLAKALAEREQQDTTSTLAVVRSWRSSPEWEALADGTKKTWRRHADEIEAEWGSAPITIWNDPRMTAKVVQWRNKRKDTPRTADIGVTVLVAFLKWARLMGKGVTLNVASDIPQLYRGAHRQEIIWTDEDMQAFEAASDHQEPPVPHIVDGMRLAALTGLRRADLVTLTFAHVGEFAVTKTALKKSRGRRRRATIPMTPALESLLTELRTRKRVDDCDTVLVNSFGRAWSGDGFGGSFNRIRDAAGVSHVDEDGNIRAKHLHDLRGTFCTMLLAECELTDEQAASIMGWSKDRVAQIRKVYVDGSRVVVAIGERIAANAKAKRAAKQ